jgi:hypothetical protein
MCDERERLLDYLYDACDADERRRVDDHLAACEDCRTEISELRAVRLDLLAWDVPAHESVWKPFAPKRTTAWWREVPAWGLAAAAGVMLLLGVGGGMAASALSASSASAPLASAGATARQAPVPAIQPIAELTPAQTAALEQRVIAALQAKLEAAQPMAAHAMPASAMTLSPVLRDSIVAQMRALIAESEQHQRQALSSINLAAITDQSKFVTRSQFDRFIKNGELDSHVQYAVAQAMLQTGGRQ